MYLPIVSKHVTNYQEQQVTDCTSDVKCCIILTPSLSQTL